MAEPFLFPDMEKGRRMMGAVRPPRLKLKVAFACVATPICSVPVEDLTDTQVAAWVRFIEGGD